MQYRSYYSGDQIIGSGGSSQFDSGVSCRSIRDQNFLFQPPSIDWCLNYDKDLLREIMLKHEAILKYQIHELHRLYGRQREMMDEIQMKKLSSNCFVSRMQCDISQKAFQQFPYWLLSKNRDNEPQGVENFQNPSIFVPGKSFHVTSDHSAVENDFKHLEASSSMRNKFRKRLLDLELPAELYMDTDEGDQLEEKKTTETHPVLHDPSINIANSSKSNLVVPSEGTSINLNSSSWRMSCVFDLNAPVQEDEPTNLTSSMYSNLSSREILLQDQDLTGSSRSKSSVLNEIVHGILEEKGSAGSSFTSRNQISFSGKLPISCNDRTGGSLEFARNEQDFIDSNKQRLLTSSMTTSSLLPCSIDINAIGSFNKQRDVPIVVQALPCFNTPALNGGFRASTGSAGTKQENLCPNLNATGCPSLGSITSRVSCDTDNQSTDEHYCVSRCFVDSHRTKEVVDLNLDVMPSSFLPETEACRVKVEFTDGGVNLDLNVMPSSFLSETEVSQEKVDNNNDLDKSDYEGKIVVNPKLLEPHSSSSQFSALTSITLPSSSSENEDVQKHEKTEIPARVMPCNSSPELENCVKDDTYLDPESVEKILESGTCIDLPFTFGEENLSQEPIVPDGVGTGFEAPDSSDNKEHSLPREDSEETQTELLEDSNKDMDRIAAETIVSISLSEGEQCLKTCINWPLDASIDCLSWFAGIVSSAGYMGDEFDDILSDAPGADCNQLTLNALRHFEAKPFKSTGTKVEDTFCKAIDRKNIISGDTEQPSQQRRGRRARNAGEQKEIQADVVPKDRTVAKRDAIKTVKGKKNVSKICRARGKKLSSKPFPNLTGRRVYLLSKPPQQQQHANESEQSFMQSWLFGWGKKNRRQKHKRAQNC